MPHSSGGGSHSGGGSSGGSSFSSGGGSHSGYSGDSYKKTYSDNGKSSKISSKPFSKARVFVYTQNGETRHIYANEDITSNDIKADGVASVTCCVAAFIMMLCVLIALVNTAFIFQRPIRSIRSYDIKIEDRAEILGETDELMSALEAFKKKTGVTPAIITVNNEDWEDYYGSLYNYAYELYVRNFDDETHWVIMYSEPETPDKNFNDWYWEGVIGDDTEKAVPQRYINGFNTNFQRYLLANKAGVAGALSDALSELTESIKPIECVGRAELLALLIAGGISALIAVPFTRQMIVAVKKISIANNCPDLHEINKKPTAEESYFDKRARFVVDCSYCGRTYTVLPDNNRCPSCGAIEYSYGELAQKGKEK